MIKIHFSRPQRGASGAAPLAVRRIGRFPFMILQNPEKRPRELDVPSFGRSFYRAGVWKKTAYGEGLLSERSSFRFDQPRRAHSKGRIQPE